MSHTPTIHSSGQMGELRKLIEQRLEPGADKQRIDELIWERFGDEWTVMFTDLVGFSRRVAEFGIIHFLQVILESERLFSDSIYRHNGIVLKTEGDSMLLVFREAQDAVTCAIEMQRVAASYNDGVEEAEKVLLCVGIGCGKVLYIGQEDVFGAEVNAAAKLGEDTAVAWEILVTDALAQKVKTMPDIGLEPIEQVPHGVDAAYRLLYQL
ncbi:MAG: adenylate/guanylate cyclase domain-containing protein [Pseudomonadota bacterium]